MLPLPNLRAVRLRALLTQEQLAQQAGLSRLSVNKIEQGQPARLSTIKKLAAALQVDPAVLMAPAPEPGEAKAA